MAQGRAPTRAVTDELVERGAPSIGCCARAELTTALRVSGSPVLLGRRFALEAEMHDERAHPRLHALFEQVLGPQIAGAFRDRRRHGRLVSIIESPVAYEAARRLGLLDPRGRIISGLPWSLVNGPRCDGAMAWRGAFLATGSVGLPRGRQAAIQLAITTPECGGLEVGVALVGLARRLGIRARVKPTTQAVRVVVSGWGDVTRLLVSIGACKTARAMAAWQSAPEAEVQASSKAQLAPFSAANVERSRQAGFAAAARAQRALDLLGDEVPEHLAAAGRLRIAHPTASLNVLSGLAESPMTKDTLAGRLRRLLLQAESQTSKSSEFSEEE